MHAYRNWRLSLPLLGAVLLACSAHSSGAGGGSTTGGAGGAGGATADGGGAGNTGTGGSPTGQDGATAGTGGASNCFPSTTDAGAAQVDAGSDAGALTACEQVCSDPAALSCPNDMTYAQCVPDCESGRAKVPQCTAEFDALQQCAASYGPCGFYCDSHGVSQLQPNLCQQEWDAVNNCILGH